MLNERNIPLEEDGIEEEILVDEEVAVTKAMWGDIGGNIENQTDLQNALDAKQDSLTEAQLNAVNSGITAGKVATYDGYADQISSKADQSALNAETTAREQADTALGTRIDNEVLARQQADNGLQTQIDAITSKSDVVDVVANYEALQAYDTSSLGNNDVIKVLDDETHEDALTYYRWSTTTQTWTYIGQEAPYYSKGQMDVMLQGKQDKLTAGDNIQIQNGTISSTDTTYTAGNGLNLNGTEFSADTDILATKEELEDYYTKPETDNLLAPKLEAEVVAELPTTGTEGKLYLTPKEHTTQTATGNPITATVAEEAGKIESFQLDGDTFQQTYEGKNLANVSAFELGNISNTGAISDDRYFHSPLIPVIAGSSYTASAIFPAEATDRYIRIAFYAADESFISRPSLVSPHTAAAPSNAAFCRIALAKTATNIMLELGSTATSFEPYVGGVPSPNPDYPQPIQTVTGEQTVTVVGKNLFNSNLTMVQGFVGNDGAINPSSTTSIMANEYIPVAENTDYIFSWTEVTTGSSVRNIAFYDSSKTFISRVQNNPTARPYTITTPAGCAYIMFNFYNANGMSAGNSLSSYLTDIQLELGSTPTAYAPYSKQTLTISLGSIELCKLGTYQDYIWKDGDSWKVHKATAKHTGDVNINTIASNLNSGPTVPSATGAGFVFNNALAGASTALMSENLGIYKLDENIVGNAGANAMTDGTFCQRQGTNDRLYFRNSAYIGKTGNEIKAILLSKSGGANVWYSLDSPTDTTITDQTLIAQLEAIRTADLENGANTITNTAAGSNLAGDMEIGYYGYNPTNRYDKFIWLDLNNSYEQIGS